MVKIKQHVDRDNMVVQMARVRGFKVYVSYMPDRSAFGNYAPDYYLWHAVKGNTVHRFDCLRDFRKFMLAY